MAKLQRVWEYHTLALATTRPDKAEAAFEATPILEGRTLFLSTPFDQVLAVDAVSGAERWRFDPHVSVGGHAGLVTSRGVAYWTNGNEQGLCAARVYVGTLDARLIALDAKTGRPCDHFGQGGSVDLRAGVPTEELHPYLGFGVTSAPTVVGDVVVVGSAVIDNQAVDVEPGIVRGYDARSGVLRWTWDPLGGRQFAHGRVGAGNTWSTMAADVERGIVYLPTGSLAPDFFGGQRPGEDRDADSLVALEAATGRKLWAFQTVHHNLWDYDVAAEPLLLRFQGRPAVAVATKTGMLFVLDRVTGAPLTPVNEVPVRRSEIAGEQASETQPVSGLTPLAPLRYAPRPAGVGSAAGDAVCAAKVRRLQYAGMFTPPSEQGTLMFPGSLGGVNWGSGAFDPETGMYYANTNRLPFEVRLLPRWIGLLQRALHDPSWYYGVGSFLAVLGGVLGWRRVRGGWTVAAVVLAAGVSVLGLGALMEFHPLIPGGSLAHFGVEVSEQRGTPYWVYRAPLVDGDGLPCVAPPWGALTGLDLKANRALFSVPVGTMRAGLQTGTTGLGGPVVTKGGLVFVAAAREPVLRAFDKRTGALVWTGPLPGAGAIDTDDL